MRKVIAWWGGILLASCIGAAIFGGYAAIWSIALLVVITFCTDHIDNRVAGGIIGISVIWLTLYACCGVFSEKTPEPSSKQRTETVETPAPQRDVDARIARGKAELDRVTAKYGKNGKLSIVAWLRPEVALPPALALLEEELAEFEIKRDEQVAAIEAAPEKFRVVVPEHWRKRFLLLTPEQEKLLGDKAESEIKKSGKTYRDAAQEARILRIMEQLWKQLPEGTPHRIILLRDEEVNAACLPNGTIFVNSGLLKQITDDNMLAFVLAHECAHYLARHGNEHATKIILTLAGEVLVERKQKSMESEGKIIRPLLLGLGYAGGSYAGAHLPFSRKMESEADALGIRLMARAGFDPNGAIKFFSFLERQNGVPGWERFLSTHPTDQKRLKHMQKECEKLKNLSL